MGACNGGNGMAWLPAPTIALLFGLNWLERRRKRPEQEEGEDSSKKPPFDYKARAFDEVFSWSMQPGPGVELAIGAISRGFHEARKGPMVWPHEFKPGAETARFFEEFLFIRSDDVEMGAFDVFGPAFQWQGRRFMVVHRSMSPDGLEYGFHGVEEGKDEIVDLSEVGELMEDWEESASAEGFRSLSLTKEPKVLAKNIWQLFASLWRESVADHNGSLDWLLDEEGNIVFDRPWPGPPPLGKGREALNAATAAAWFLLKVVWWLFRAVTFPIWVPAWFLMQLLMGEPWRSWSAKRKERKRMKREASLPPSPGGGLKPIDQDTGRMIDWGVEKQHTRVEKDVWWINLEVQDLIAKGNDSTPGESAWPEGFRPGAGIAELFHGRRAVRRKAENREELWEVGARTHVIGHLRFTQVMTEIENGKIRAVFVREASDLLWKGPQWPIGLSMGDGVDRDIAWIKQWGPGKLVEQRLLVAGSLRHSNMGQQGSDS